MKKRNGWISAAELAARLEQDTAYQNDEAQRNQARVEREIQIRELTGPILADLRNLGVVVEEWNELVNRYAPLSVPVTRVLLSWLPRTEDVGVQEMIVRALAAASPTHRFDGGPLATVFNETSSDSLRWAIANTLAVVRAEHIEGWIVTALQRPGSGKAREMLCIAAARLLKPEIANPLLISLLREMPGHAALGLAISGSKRELVPLESQLRNTKGWARREVEKAISAIRRNDAGADSMA